MRVSPNLKQVQDGPGLHQCVTGCLQVSKVVVACLPTLLFVLLCVVCIATKAAGHLQAVTGCLGVVVSCMMAAGMVCLLLHSKWVLSHKVRAAKLVAAHSGEAYSWYSQHFTVTDNVLVTL